MTSREERPSTGPHPVARPAEGATPTERYLAQLARRSFLRLWSYSSLFRDQGTGERGGEGAELCDLLVVFENDVLIFSDKDCVFPEHDDVELAWQRWYRRAIDASAKQTAGAERWLRAHPDRVFTDRACRHRVPINIPGPEHARYHRIVVAHDTTGRRRQLTGGSGSLMLNPAIAGKDHLRRRADGGHPFAIGHVDPERGYVHVFDDVSLDIVLRTLDTITDFVRYLDKKAALLESDVLHGAFGEEDLLAFYLKNTNDREEHDFVFPDGATKVLLEEGHWRDYVQRDGVRRKWLADRESYRWDEMIDHLAGHALAGTLLHTNHPAVTDQEHVYRVLAREPRVRRRMLARALLERVTSPPPPGLASFRTMFPSEVGDPHYVYVVMTPPLGMHGAGHTYDEYRNERRELVAHYAIAAMEHFSGASRVVGIATEGGGGHGRTFDVVMITRDAWDDDLAADARHLLAAYGWFQNLQLSTGVEQEYPDGPPEIGRSFRRLTHKVGRNEPCGCGSRKKFKKCHGKP